MSSRPTDCYAGVKALLADGQQQGRWSAELVDVTDTDAVLAAAAQADLLWLESPTNPLLEIADLPALCRAGQAGRPLVAVDNTFATSLLQQPLALGADVVVHSATKFIGGHSDLLLGVAVAHAQLGRAAAPPPRGRWRDARRVGDVPGAARRAHHGGAPRSGAAQRR